MEFESILSESQSEVLTADTKVTPKKTTTIEKHTAYHLYVHYYMTGCTLCKFAMQLAPHSMF